MQHRAAAKRDGFGKMLSKKDTDINLDDETPGEEGNFSLSEVDWPRAESDEREFEKIKLDNEVNVLMLSKPNSQESVVAVAVQAGSYMDKYLGTAHMLEHSLFLGSEKYHSGSSDFDDCIGRYSGTFNAFTGYSESCYYFSSASSGFNECLDIFAHFFIDPLLDETAVTGELNAVDSEYRKDLPIEWW